MPVLPASVPSAGPSAPESESPPTQSRNGEAWFKGRTLTGCFATVDDGDTWFPITAAFESVPGADAGASSVLANAAITPAAPRVRTTTAIAVQRLWRRRDSRRTRRAPSAASEASGFEES